MHIWGYFFTIVLTALITGLVSGLLGSMAANDRLRQEIKKLEKRD